MAQNLGAPVGMGGAGGVGIIDPFRQFRHTTPLNMLQMRMRWGEYDPDLDTPFRQGGLATISPFTHIDVVYSGKEYIIFIVNGSEPVTLRDSTELFPSDTLVTQLRMLVG